MEAIIETATESPMPAEQPVVARPVQTTVLLQNVTVTDIKMPFGSMVRFMIKAALAAIPAALILGFIWMLFLVFLMALNDAGLKK